MNIPFCSGPDEMNSSVSSCTTPFHCLPLSSGFWSRQDSFFLCVCVLICIAEIIDISQIPSEQMLKPVSGSQLQPQPSFSFFLGSVFPFHGGVYPAKVPMSNTDVLNPTEMTLL